MLFEDSLEEEASCNDSPFNALFFDDNVEDNHVVTFTFASSQVLEIFTLPALMTLEMKAIYPK